MRAKNDSHCRRNLLSSPKTAPTCCVRQLIQACDYVGGRILWYENLDGNGSLSVAIDIAVEEGVWEVGRFSCESFIHSSILVSDLFDCR